MIAQAASHAGSILRRERDSRLRVAAQHEQVRQVRARKQQRRGVRHEDCAVEERALVEAAVARRVHEHRREEHHRRVQIEHGGHRRDEREQADEQAARAEPRAGEAGSGCLEQAVVGRHGSDQEQSDDEHESGPDLVRRS